MAEAATMEATKHGEVARLDPLLHGVALRLRDAPCRDRCVDAVGERRLQRVAELRRRDPELLRGVVDDRLALCAGDVSCDAATATPPPAAATTQRLR